MKETSVELKFKLDGMTQKYTDCNFNLVQARLEIDKLTKENKVIPDLQNQVEELEAFKTDQLNKMHKSKKEMAT